MFMHVKKNTMVMVTSRSAFQRLYKAAESERQQRLRRAKETEARAARDVAGGPRSCDLTTISPSHHPCSIILNLQL